MIVLVVVKCGVDVYFYIFSEVKVVVIGNGFVDKV